MVMKIVDSSGSSGRGSFRDDLVKLMKKLEPGEGVQVPRSDLPRNYGQLVVDLMRDPLPFPWHLNEESDESVTFYRDAAKPKFEPAAKPAHQAPDKLLTPPAPEPKPDSPVYDTDRGSINRIIEEVKVRGGSFPVPKTLFRDAISRSFCMGELRHLGYRVDKGINFDVIIAPEPVPCPKVENGKKNQAPKDITHRSPLVKVPMRERILTSIKKNPGIAHSALRKKFTRSTEEGKKFDNAIGDLLVENLVVSTSVKWTGPYGLKTTYRIVGAKAAATEVAPVHGQHPAKTVVLGVEAAPKPVLSPAPPVVTPALPKTEPQPKPEPKPEPKPQPKPEAKPITREEVAAVQKMIKPEKFPTGNRCFACVDEDHVRVCGETASVTYKQVRLCRTHMNRLFYARKLYVRTSLKHNPILLKKT